MKRNEREEDLSLRFWLERCNRFGLVLNRVAAVRRMFTSVEYRAAGEAHGHL